MADDGHGSPEFVLPVGTVTLLLADVEGSTRLWQSDAASMRDGMVGLDEVVSDAVGRNGGVRPVEQGEGDSFVAAFARASDAIAAAVDLQRAETDPVSLRIGIHTGDVQMRGEGNYIGLAINRCARLRDLGHGGQTLVSQATRDLVEDDLPGEVWLLDLGVHRLRDLARPEHVHQLCCTEVRHDFPALRSLDSRPHNLPVQLTSFVGREPELAEIATLLERARLLTLTGSGGCGKTRLALQAAADALPRFDDGVWLLDLAPLDNRSELASPLAHVLGVPEHGARSPLEVVVGHLHSKRALLVLDNCEHVIDAGATLVEHLLQSCAHVSIIATSREPLGVAGEFMWRVPSLRVLEEGARPTIEAVTHCEAVELFTERARRADPGFAVTPQNATAVSEICRRLDGIPLAIELAASRVRVFTPEQIAQRLNDRFRLLTGGSRTSMPRQQTLWASVEWSHQLLTAPEQVLLRRLAVFSGSFDFDATVAVGAGDPLEAHQIVDLLSLLVDKSLVTTVERDGQARYRLLETVRDFAALQVDTSGELGATAARHRDHYRLLAEQTFRQFSAMDPSWTRQCTEFDNLRTAFEFCRRTGDIEGALAIASFMMPTWGSRGPAKQGYTWLESVLDEPAAVADRTRAFALMTCATLTLYLGNIDTRSRGDEAVAIARTLDDDGLLSYALCSAGWPRNVREPEVAVGFFDEAVELARAGSPAGLIHALSGLATALLTSFEVDRAVATFEEVVTMEAATGYLHSGATSMLAHILCYRGELARSRELCQTLAAATSANGNTTGLSAALFNGSIAAALMGAIDDAKEMAHRSLAFGNRDPYYMLGFVALGTAHEAANEPEEAYEAFCRAMPQVTDVNLNTFMGVVRNVAEIELQLGDHEAARRHANEAVARTEDDDRNVYLGRALETLARVSLSDGDLQHAEPIAQRSLLIARTVGDLCGVAQAMETLAFVQAAQGDHLDAVRLLAAADSVRERISFVRFAMFEQAYQSVAAGLRDAVGAGFADAWTEGAAMSVDEAVGYARRGRGERKRPAFGWESLTPSEVNVARLVSAGLDNGEIAKRLFISGRTVQSHLTHIYAKLGVTSRVRLANEAAPHTST